VSSVTDCGTFFPFTVSRAFTAASIASFAITR